MKSYSKLLQCKDIPELPILEFLREACDKGISENDYPQWSFTAWADGKWDNDLQAAMPPGTPFKIGWKKMSQMKKKGLVDGCDCGCRGDWTITDKGREVLARGNLHGEQVQRKDE